MKWKVIRNISNSIGLMIHRTLKSKLWVSITRFTSEFSFLRDKFENNWALIHLSNLWIEVFLGYRQPILRIKERLNTFHMFSYQKESKKSPIWSYSWCDTWNGLNRSSIHNWEYPPKIWPQIRVFPTTIPPYHDTHIWATYHVNVSA